MTAPATRTPTSWQPPEGMTFEAWQEFFEALMVVHDSLPWLLGDCLNAGKAAFGEDYSQVLPTTRTAETLRGYQWVSECVAAVTRATDLSWSHHRAVARLDAPEQVRWLDRARAEGLSVKALKDALRPVTVVPEAGAGESDPDEPTVEILPPVARPESQITLSPQGGKGPWRDAIRTLWRAGEEEWRREMIEELKLDIPGYEHDRQSR